MHNYRSEIDGLRALAVLPVVFFHAGMELFSGGFIGVDIFFVISGYLITTLIYLERSKGDFSIVRFYERRARRIYPALFMIMGFSSVFAWILLPPVDIREYGQSLISVVLFVSNHFFLNKTEYFGIASELKPLLHTWSLAVEEQYYLIFPIFFYFFGKLKYNYLIKFLFLMAVTSILFSHWGSYNIPAANFFILPTRAWELLIGALVAFYLLKFSPISSRYGSFFSFLGLCIVVLSVFFFQRETLHPSLYTLLPVTGAALIISFANSKNLVGRFLSIKPMVWLGLISYSLYLIHQPLFAFARHYFLLEPDVWIMILLSFSAVFFAFLNWRFVEQPFRNKIKFNAREIFIVSVSGSILFLILGLVFFKSDGFKNRFNISNDLEDQFTTLSMRNKCDEGKDKSDYQIDFCEMGAIHRDKVTIAVFGDSHSEALNPLFNTLGIENNVKYVHLGLGGCPPLLDVDVMKGSYAPGVCRDLSERQFNYVKQNNVKKVFLIARWTLYTDGDYRHQMKGSYLVADSYSDLSMSNSRLVFENKMKSTIKAYNSIGTEVIIMMQPPQQLLEPIRFYQKISRHSLKNKVELEEIIMRDSVTVKQHEELQKFNRKVFLELENNLNVSILNPDLFFCNTVACRFGTPSIVYYRDNDHLTTFGAFKLKELISPYFR